MPSYITASNGSQQPMFLIVMSLLVFLSVVTVSLRLYCRIFRVHKVGADDYLIVAAVAVTIGMTVMNGLHVAQGTGCGGALLMRLFPQAFECHSKPWRAWDPSFPAGCYNLNAAYYSIASISIFTDLAILVLPLPQLMKLNIHQKCMPTSIETERILLWTQIEVNVAIISASAPSLRPLFASIFKGSSYGRGGPSSARYGGYGSSYGREESHYRRTLTRHGNNHGAIELTSRDEERYAGRVHGVTQPSSKA
ncbi:hypothetical protein ASPVEDRAFT_35069 [Aspergillus versicolor CBS 583.65]|uniref:Rhodopsin domain-containing protein n=1 Tax=Aspergillus versicolor CBS 583.65 TaxID=1036611 RepID=A0A1L9Q5A0_ASPVE|nr:uncharacterized protein ASPVEDRAFT_35069 [Aspergillus versicolor CBS 583.65]OJJ08950.1 hypothetical protein ASPVEDRAFT_35069 [Aspergillus versicolor CBS 583.65]